MPSATVSSPPASPAQPPIKSPLRLTNAGIPLICLLYAGEAESAVTKKPDLLWPHQKDFDDKNRDIAGVGVQLNSYLERSFIGWLELGTYDEKDRYTLSAPNGNLPAFVIFKDSDSDSKEYFVVETRYPSTWNPAEHGTRLMITRYAYDDDDWLYDRPNNVKANKRGMVITADQQKIDDNAKPSNLFGNGVNAISGLKVVFSSR